MIELLNYEFARNALIAGSLISILFGFLSFFVVMKKLSFLTVGISHAAFGGIALGLLIGLSPYPTAIIFCILTGFLIASQSNRSEYDTVIGIIFALTMALGVIFLSLRKSYTFDLMSYLFGSILGINKTDLLFITITTILVTLFFTLFFKEIIFITFDKTVAKASGLPVDVFEYSIVAILSFVIVFSIKLIGIILVSAFLIIPAATTIFIANNYKKVIMLSIVLNLVIFYSGFFLSYKLDLPAGATIVTIGALIFFATSFINKKFFN